MAQVNNPFVAKMAFRFKSWGFTERYLLKATNWNDAKAAADSLANARLACATSNLEMVLCHVMKVDKARNAKSIDTSNPKRGHIWMYRMGDEAEASPLRIEQNWKTNDVSDCFMIRQETAEGLFSNRFVHAVPDILVEENYSPATPIESKPFMNHFLSKPLGDYMIQIAENTQYGKLIDKANLTFDVHPWESVVQKGHRNKRTGSAPFRPRGRSGIH